LEPDSDVCIVTRRSGIRIPKGRHNFLISQTSRPALGPLSLLFNGYGPYPRGESDRASLLPLTPI